MAEIIPFKGLRYNLNKPEELGLYIAPPYDMLDEKDIERLYNKSDYNIVRITQNKPQQNDRENKDRHIRAANLLKDWIDKRIIIRDEEPSIYIYKQKFSLNNFPHKEDIIRTGIVALVRVVDFEEKIIFPHEATLSGPKIDRYELLEATKTHTEQIFGLLNDNGDFFEIASSINKEPEGIFVDENEVTHILYKCSDPNVINKIIQIAKDKTILIADGHHRYETSLNFYRNNRKPEFAYTLMTLVSTVDPGLVIRPFHRVIKKENRNIELLKELEKYFTIKNKGSISLEEINKFLIEDKCKDILYFDFFANKLYLCSLNSQGERYLLENIEEHTIKWKKLPVSIINVIIINKILGLPLDGKVLHDKVEYVNDAKIAIEKYSQKRDEYYGIFFVSPLNISLVNEIVSSGERMPQKSTNFYPKIYSGLVLHKMDLK